MIGDLIRRLTEASERPLLPTDGRLAYAALMVRLARSDDSYTDRERTRIDRLLAEHYGLTPAEAARLRGEAETAEAAAPDTVQFTRLIKQAVPYEDRTGVVEALWRVATADGIDADERAFLRLVANLLGVSDQDSGLARQRAEERD
ncbi:MAG: TerB family tellurite resistance protein [Amaricoccus sp.]